MKNRAVLFILVALIGPIWGCGNNLCHLGIGSCAVPQPAVQPPQKKAESESGFNPNLGTEIVVRQRLEQKYSCDGKQLLSEEKSFIHEGYPELKANPKRNIPIRRATFTNLTNNRSVDAGIHFASDDLYKYFRVYIEPRHESDFLGRFGAPLLPVVKGENQVHYKYESCQKEDFTDDEKKSKTCVQWFVEEEGEITVTIGITERTERPTICRRYPTNCLLSKPITYGSCE